MTTNKQRRFLKKLYRMKSMSFDYLDKHYPDRLYDKELGAPAFQQYIEGTSDNTGITISVDGIIELQDFHRYLRHWRIPVVLSAIAIAVSTLSIGLSLLLPQTVRIIP